MRTRRRQGGRVDEPFVRIERDPFIESLLQQGENVVGLNSTCFVCGGSQQANSVGRTTARGRRGQDYTEQTSLFKDLLMNAQVRKRMSPKAYNHFSKNVESCAGCLGMIKKVWDLSQEINRIRDELDKVLVKARERLSSKCDMSSGDHDQTLRGRTRKVSKRKHSPPRSMSPTTNDDMDTFLDVIKEEVCSIGDADSYVNEMSPYHHLDEDEIDTRASPIQFEAVMDGIVPPTSDDLHSDITTTAGRSKRNTIKLLEISPTKVKSEWDEDENGDDAYEESNEDSDYEYDESESKGKAKVQVQRNKNKQSDDKPKKFQCSKCGKTVTRKRTLIFHEILVCKVKYDQQEIDRMNIKFLYCDQCDGRFVDKEHLAKHLRTHAVKSKTRLTCSICEKKFKKRQDLIKHEISVCKINYDETELERMNMKFYNCTFEQCRFRSVWPGQLKKHILFRHSENGKIITMCPSCGNSNGRCGTGTLCSKCKVMDKMDFSKIDTNGDENETSKTYELLSHSESENSEQSDSQMDVESGTDHPRELKIGDEERIRTHECPKCPKRFINRTKLIAHFARHQKKGYKYDNSIICDICGKILSQRRSLSKHIRRVHSKEGRLHNCSYCSKGFFTPIDLQRHVKTHKKDESSEQPQPPVKCDLCNKVVKHEAALVRHKRTFHERTSGKFQCQVCHLRFYLQHDLRKHEKTHSNPVYTCSKCGRVYKSLTHFENHQKQTNCDDVPKTHTKRNKQPMKCPHCQEFLKGRRMFQLHMKDIHPELVGANQNDMDNSQRDDLESQENKSASNQNDQFLEMQVGFLPQF